MQKKTTLLAVGLLLLTSVLLQAQSLRDSVYFPVGIPETTEFKTDTRVYFESYNADGKPLEVRSERKNNNGNWADWRRRLFTYEDGLLTQLLIQYWGAGDQDWKDAIEKTFTYDSDENRTSKSVRRASGLGMPLQNTRRWTYTYTNGNETSQLYEEWNGNDWENVSQQLWTYNADQLVQEKLLQLWIMDTWNNVRRQVWDYDPGTLVTTLIVQQSWNPTAEVWENNERMVYEHNGLGFWTGIRKSVWDSISESWLPLEQDLFEYNSSLQLEQRVRQVYEDGNWQNNLRLAYEFDGTTLSSLADNWDTDAAQWELLARYFTEYDSERRPIVEQGWEFWNTDTQGWENDSITFQRTTYWSSPVSTQEIILPTACLVPNPYTTGMTFSCATLDKPATLTLVNLVGQVQYRTVLQPNSTHELPGSIPTGLYLLHLDDGQHVRHLQKLFITQ
ncbi:MAG: T9SS type A sorting domain-containing protein [Phaeodactylibacter sp.]|nr:T9SS type A sorting domain-containing protein [Phaeodactylibacter sp.]